MKITRLHLENFRGIKELDIDFGPNTTNIYGANGTGKTTIANAVSWILFGKAATGEKDFNPKIVGVHDLHHIAEVTFQTENGRIVRLKKDFYEIWSKKKGSKTKTFSGNTTDYWVDDIPYKENVYTKTIQSLCGGTLEIAKLLTMYDYFPEVMNVEERRKVLFEVCGDMTDEEVIAQTPELADLQTFLKQPGTSGQMYTPDEYKKIAMDQRRKLNDNLKMLPARIDEVTKSIPETLPDEKKIQKKIATLQEQSNGIDADIREIQNGDTQALAIQKKIAALSTELEQSRMAFTEKMSAEYQKQYAQQAKIQKQRYALDEKYAKASAELKKQTAAVEDMKQQRNRLLRKFSEVQESQWDEGQQICPTCHRPLPADKIAEMRKQFNAAKSAHLEAINERGKLCGKEVIGSMEAQINAIKKSMEQIGADKMASDKNKEAVHRILANQPRFEDTDHYRELMGQYRELQDKDTDSGMAINAAIASKHDVNILDKNVDISTKNDNISSQSRVKESKVDIPTTTEYDETFAAVAKSYQDNIRPVMNAIESDKLMDLVETYGKDSCLKAIERAVVRGKPNLSYIAGILNSWQQHGYDEEGDASHGRTGTNSKHMHQISRKNGSAASAAKPAAIDWSKEPDTL